MYWRHPYEEICAKGSHRYFPTMDDGRELVDHETRGDKTHSKKLEKNQHPVISSLSVVKRTHAKGIKSRSCQFK